MKAATTERMVSCGLGRMIRKKRVRVGEKARRVVPMVRLGDVMLLCMFAFCWVGFLANWKARAEKLRCRFVLIPTPRLCRSIGSKKSVSISSLQIRHLSRLRCYH